MARASAVAVENNFSRGLITEATGINFPENACKETYDCVFSIDGSVERRFGFDFEASNSTKTIDRTNSVVVSYLWRNVSGDGNVTLLVVQVGSVVYFYRVGSSSLSSGAVSTTVTLSPVSGAPATNAVEAQFSDGNGLLFITHPYCEPIRVSYNTSTDTATATNITLKIRDFEGSSADPYAVDERPTTTLAGMNVDHKYNLYNQGWNTTNLTAWDTAQTTMPSNADVMWRFKDSSDNFDASSASIARITAGNTPAPKGHFILTLSNQDRDTAAGTSGVAATTTGSQRPSTSAFFAGRVFYAGVNYTGFNSKIFFTQVIERTEQYGFCYQTNDPTAEDLFDLLPTDGGVISIPESGTVFKLVTVPGGLAVFAANGVWFVTGSSGLGFIANDYTVQKIATIRTISASSFVDVAGYPAWWNEDGIYLLEVAQGTAFPSVKLLTQGTIQTFFDEISSNSKKYSKGFYHPIEKHIQWIYKSADTDQITNRYEYDRILNINVLTGAFFPWIVSSSDVKINGIAVTDSITGVTEVDNVIDGSSNNVIDGSGNNVIVFSTSGVTSASSDKYIVSYPDSGSYKFTFAETRNTDYLDWFQYDTIGVDFTSYFISGYRLRGEGIRKFQSNWIKIFSKISEPVAYYFQGLWDYAQTGDTGRWSSKQYIAHSDTDYGYSARRLKVRGHGIVLQFKVESVSGQPFHVIGWVSHDTGNQFP